MECEAAGKTESPDLQSDYFCYNKGAFVISIPCLKVAWQDHVRLEECQWNLGGGWEIIQKKERNSIVGNRLQISKLGETVTQPTVASLLFILPNGSKYFLYWLKSTLYTQAIRVLMSILRPIFNCRPKSTTSTWQDWYCLYSGPCTYIYSYIFFLV